MGALAFPLVGTFHCQPGWPRRAMAAYAALVAGFGLVGMIWLEAVIRSGGAASRGSENPTLTLIVLSVLGSIAGTWLTRILGQIRPKR